MQRSWLSVALSASYTDHDPEVTTGFPYKMRAVYTHFCISAVIQENGSRAETRNFLGGKIHLIWFG